MKMRWRVAAVRRTLICWEGEDRTEYDMTKGFVVPGSETESFLREKLEFLGPK